ncbi:hypothetical protein MKW92_050017, partial [Papaver armeniacum]
MTTPSARDDHYQYEVPLLNNTEEIGDDDDDDTEDYMVDCKGDRIVFENNKSKY